MIESDSPLLPHPDVGHLRSQEESTTGIPTSRPHGHLRDCLLGRRRRERFKLHACSATNLQRPVIQAKGVSLVATDMLDTQSSEDLASLQQRRRVLRGIVRAERWAPADKARAQRNPRGMREHGRIFGQIPRSVPSHQRSLPGLGVSLAISVAAFGPEQSPDQDDVMVDDHPQRMRRLRF